MGGEKFDSTHPEGYLFGENSDLNFLGNRPVAVRRGKKSHFNKVGFVAVGGMSGHGTNIPF